MNYEIKMAVIAGASRALKLRNEKFRASDSEILKEITANMEEIIEKIDEGK